jgi:Leucine-rich repeat (LRR) protein
MIDSMNLRAACKRSLNIVRLNMIKLNTRNLDFAARFAYLQQLFICPYDREPINSLATLSHLTTLQTLDLHTIHTNEDVELTVLNGITALMALRCLNLGQCVMHMADRASSDHLLMLVTGLVHLTSLDLGGLHVHDISLLATLSSMQSLGISNCSSDCIPQLSSLPCLTKLDVSYSSYTDQQLETLACLTNLIELDLSMCVLPAGVGLAHLSKLKLRRLDLWDTQEAPGLDACVVVLTQQLTHLTYLDIHDTTQLTDTGLAQLSLLKHLQYLDIKQCDSLRGESWLSQLPKLSHLQHLSLCPCENLVASPVPVLAQLTSLTYLFFAFDHAYLGEHFNVDRLVKLEFLEVRGVPFDRLVNLQRLVALTELEMYGAGATATDLQLLNHSLTRLHRIHIWQ